MESPRPRSVHPRTPFRPGCEFERGASAAGGSCVRATGDDARGAGTADWRAGAEDAQAATDHAMPAVREKTMRRNARDPATAESPCRGARDRAVCRWAGAVDCWSPRSPATSHIRTTLTHPSEPGPDGLSGLEGAVRWAPARIAA